MEETTVNPCHEAIRQLGAAIEAVDADINFLATLSVEECSLFLALAKEYRFYRV